MLCLPQAGLAQSTSAAPAEDLSGKVKPGQRIFVTDGNGVQTEGRVRRVARGELTLLVDGHERTFRSGEIGRVEKRDSLWNGMLIGAVPAALLGGAAAGASCSPRCSRDVPLGMLVFGAMGAGLGALIDAGVGGYSVIDGPALASPNARAVPAPVTSFDHLWLRVRQGDRIDVMMRSGQTFTGRFVRVSSLSVTMMVDGGALTLPVSAISRVTRAGNRYRSGALWGGVIIGTIGLLQGASCNGCGNPVLAGMLMGGTGALWGAAIGAAVPKHPVVYGGAASSRAYIAPIIGARRIGVAVSATF